MVYPKQTLSRYPKVVEVWGGSGPQLPRRPVYSLFPQLGARASVAISVAPGRPLTSPYPDTEPDTGPGHHPLAPPGRSCLGPATVPVSATLAVNEVMDARRTRGEPVLPMGFGEAGLPAHPLLREALSRAAGRTSYGPVAGEAALLEAAAGYWSRRDLPTDPDAVVAGPGSKALLFGLTEAIGGDVAVTRPSWVSYAAQASLARRVAHFVPGAGGVPDASELARTVNEAKAAGRTIRSVIVTLPDNPTGTLASAAAVRALGGVPDASELARTVNEAKAAGRTIRSVIVTLPDNPTGTLASAAAVRALGA